MRRPSRLIELAIALGLLCAFTITISAQPVRLAVITTSDREQDSIADLLMVELSKQPGAIMLERAEINRVLGEQKLSALAGGDYVKLGHLLSGDGLLVLETQTRDGKTVLAARLIAVNPGVVLVSETAPWPLKDAAEWCRTACKAILSILPQAFRIS